MRPTIFTPVTIEVVLLFLAVGGSIFAQTQPSLFVWSNVVVFGSQTFFSAFFVILSFYYSDLYDLRIVRNFSEFITRLPRSSGIAFVLLCGFYALYPLMGVAGGPIFSSLSIACVVLPVVLPVRWVLYRLLNIRSLTERVLILGTSPLAWKIVEEIEATPHVGYTIVGLVEDQGASGSYGSQSSQYPMRGPLERLNDILNELRPDRIIVALTERRGRLPVRDLLDARMAGIIVEDGIEVHERLTEKLAIESLTPSFLFFSEDFTKSRFQMALRRMVSLAFALVGILLTFPLMVLIALTIKIDSSGSAFFIQDRAGLHGRTFRLIKFRTMHPLQPGKEYEEVWERDVSSRVTRVGKWLRKLRLDEVPQFINIMRGDMDLVGPRPEMVSNVKTMIEQIPYYSLRMVVRPGITGWAQVRHGYSVSQEDVTEKMRYDLYYVKHMSPWFDLRILIDTVKIVLLGRDGEKKESAETKESPSKLTTSAVVNVTLTNQR
ncbi:MAG: exopolysaccharide biosynthesis polyprenyl glycosylphosphotransferase [Deltaproteobacteria bacterium]|nr:exopolysaccharide biosynthesis polyprenyl glycosylphosphotransferase [Deltaproteobacteria bacterium]